MNHLNLQAYISPTINQFTTVYAQIGDAPTRKYLTDLAKLNGKTKNFIKQYSYPPCCCLVSLATYLSVKFSCPVLAAYVYDGSILWYHLNQFGEMLDEYITCGDHSWKPGLGIYDLPPNGQIKGGDATKVCTAFGKEDAVQQVEYILREPRLSPVERHELLARALGIYPGLVAGLNYMAVDTGEFRDFWNDFYDWEDYDYYLPSPEEANLLLKQADKTIK